MNDRNLIGKLFRCVTVVAFVFGCTFMASGCSENNKGCCGDKTASKCGEGCTKPCCKKA